MPKQKSQRQASEDTSWTLRSVYPPLPGHPVQSALRLAACQRFDDGTELVHTMGRLKPTPANEAKVVSMATKVVALFKELNELLDWVNRNQGAASSEQANRVAEAMLKAGFSASETLDLAKKTQRRPRKRPADKRPLAIDAFEMQLADTRRTWRELAKQAYGCRHPRKEKCKCGELLRQEVIHVKRFLAKMHIAVPKTPRK